jgi:hypothetical protein
MKNIFEIPYHRMVLDASKLRFGASNIKSRKKAEDIPLLGAYRIVLKNEKKYIGYLNYKTGRCDFDEIIGD